MVMREKTPCTPRALAREEDEDNRQPRSLHGWLLRGVPAMNEALATVLKAEPLSPATVKLIEALPDISLESAVLLLRLAQREVSKEEGIALAAELGIGLFETSALRGDHVDDVFMTLARDIRKQQQEDGPEGAPPKTPQPLQVASGSQLRARLGLCC